MPSRYLDRPLRTFAEAERAIALKPAEPPLRQAPPPAPCAAPDRSLAPQHG